jgi:hypothetical protein
VVPVRSFRCCVLLFLPLFPDREAVLGLGRVSDSTDALGVQHGRFRGCGGGHLVRARIRDDCSSQNRIRGCRVPGAYCENPELKQEEG